MDHAPLSSGHNAWVNSHIVLPLPLPVSHPPAVEEATDLVEFGVEASLEETLEEGVRRLAEVGRPTWKVWAFEGEEVYDSDSFRTLMHEQHIKPELLALLPKEDPKVSPALALSQ